MSYVISRGTAVLMAVAMLAGEGDGYCAGAGANPGFLSAPHVEQVSNGGRHVGGRGGWLPRRCRSQSRLPVCSPRGTGQYMAAAMLAGEGMAIAQVQEQIPASCLLPTWNRSDILNA
jgi:hypothetical protein